MATYVNDLRLKEIATGDESGTWGTSTNTNLELIGEAMGYGTEVVANASTHTITMADGATDGFRCTFLRLTGGVGNAVTGGDSNYTVTGVAATAELSSVIVWGNLIPDQTPSWSATTPSQSPSWSEVTPSQSPDWEDIAA